MRRAMGQSAWIFASISMALALAGCGGKTTTPPSPTPIPGPPGSRVLESASIPVGESRTFQNAAGVRTVVTCPAGGPACVVMVAEDGTATYTGGMPTVTTYMPLELPRGHSLPAGVTTIPAGESRTVHDAAGARTEVACPAGGSACVVTVAESGAESTGGTPTVATYLDVPGDHSLSAGVTTIPAGDSRELAAYSRGRSYALVCPVGDGSACVVTVAEDGAVASTGGTPYVETTTNEMVWQANNGPGGASRGAHARGLEGRLVPLPSLFRYGNAGFALRSGTIGQSTVDADPVVTPSISRTGHDAPTLGLTLGTTAFSTLPPSELGLNPGRLSVERYSAIPSLGTDWNGVALSRKGIPGGKTVHAVLYSNIESPSGGTPDANYLLFGAWLALPNDHGAASTEYNMGVFADGAPAGRMTQQQVNSLTGWVSYRGPATGLYSKASYSGSGGARTLTSADVGSFTATTTVSTNFGTSGTVAGMTGTVTDFRENGESLGNWRVNLLDNNGFTFGVSNTIFNIGRTSGTADGRSLNDNGTWAVQYYRDGVRSGAGHAVGTFTASTPAAANDALHIVGAFGLERQ